MEKHDIGIAFMCMGFYLLAISINAIALIGLSGGCMIGYGIGRISIK